MKVIVIQFWAILWLLTGCAASATQSNSASGIGEETSSASGSYVAPGTAWGVPVLGVITDGNLRIVEIVPGSAAEKAGLQRADVLIELRLITAESVPDPSVTLMPEADVAVEGLLPPATVEPRLMQPIPFTNEAAIGDLLAQTIILKEIRKVPFGPINYKPESGPFIIKVQRGDQVLELPIIAENPPSVNVRAGEPTPTAIPQAYSYF